MAKDASSPLKSSKTISLKTADGNMFKIEVAIAKPMKTVQAFIEEVNTAIIPLPNVAHKDLAMIVEYCKKEISGEITEDFEPGFVKEINNEELKVLLLAAYYLDVDRLYKFLCKTIASRIENKSVEYVRNYFGIKNDFTPEEEA
jgi:S-phase kinase-associated protein 1